MILKDSYRFDTWYIGESNQMATNQVKAVLNGTLQANPLIIAGESGSGKTHLITAMVHEMSEVQHKKIWCALGDSLVSHYISYIRETKNHSVEDFGKKFDAYDGVVLGDMHWWLGYESMSHFVEELVTILVEQNKQVVLTVCMSQKDKKQTGWNGALSHGVWAFLEKPGIDIREKVLTCLVEESGIETTEGVKQILLQKAQDMRQLVGMWNRCHALVELMGYDLTETMVQETLDKL